MSKSLQTSAPRGLGFFPIINSAKHYNPAFFRPDLIAGVTVTALIAPKNLGYAEIAGAPIENGLYAAAAGAILYAVFGTSRQISIGSSSALAAVAGSAVMAARFSDETDDATFVSAIAIGAGRIFLLMSFLKMGWISQFISRAVITGVLFGAAVDVTTEELSKLTGTDGGGDNSWQKFELSERENEVLRLAGTGMLNSEIGKRLFISEATIKRYMNHLLRKLGAENRIQATQRARKMGLL